MMLTWVDPLRLTLETALSSRDSSLLVVRQNFGSETHFKYLAEIISGMRNQLGTGHVIVDLTPFQRLGNRIAFQKFLLSEGLLAHTFLLVATQTLYEDLLAISQSADTEALPVVLFKLEDGQLSTQKSPLINSLLEQVTLSGVPPPPQSPTYSRLRMNVIEKELLEQVNAVTLTPPDDRWKGETETIADQQFLRMPNGMLVTHFVLMKALLHRAETIDRIAYEVAAHACHGFCPETEDLWPDLFVASSDHAYLIGSAVQRLTGIKCAVIDRIGLLPGRRLTRDTISLDVTGKRVALLVDVSATASEMERAASLLVHRGARLQMILCCVWLECAIPKFVDWFPFVPLCKPKRQLDFIYRSAQ